MNDEITKKLNEISISLATNNANIKSFMDLDHEARIRTLENSIATLVESVKSLVKTIEERKNSNHYWITTALALLAVIISIFKK